MSMYGLGWWRHNHAPQPEDNIEGENIDEEDFGVWRFGIDVGQPVDFGFRLKNRVCKRKKGCQN